jgi:hypothetical protein
MRLTNTTQLKLLRTHSHVFSFSDKPPSRVQNISKYLIQQLADLRRAGGFQSRPGYSDTLFSSVPTGTICIVPNLFLQQSLTVLAM